MQCKKVAVASGKLLDTLIAHQWKSLFGPPAELDVRKVVEGA